MLTTELGNSPSAGRPNRLGTLPSRLGKGASAATLATAQYRTSSQATAWSGSEVGVSGFTMM